MTAEQPTIVEELDSGSPNRLPNLLSESYLGRLLAMLVQDMANTETGVIPASDIATLAAIPERIYDVVVTAATGATGRYALKQGDASVLPGASECVWNPGTDQVTFNATDAVTAVDFKYAAGTETLSFLDRRLSQVDS